MLTSYRGGETNRKDHRANGGGGFVVICESDDIDDVHKKDWRARTLEDRVYRILQYN
jgi:hypothetical protein